MYSKPIQQLIAAFSRLPGVGPRTAERYVFYLLKSGKKDVGELTLALKNLITTVKSCTVCYDFSDTSPCAICRDQKRDMTRVCIVAEPTDVQALERTGSWQGLYHVLRGTIDSADPESIAHVKLPELFARAEKNTLAEAVLALNPDVTGETTMLYIEQRLKEIAPAMVITRLARGLPMGSDLRYADEITLGSALKHRTRT
ncbi:MAG: recombination mediator RecR [Patescibacteria group bacterium]